MKVLLRRCDHNKNKQPNCPICLKRQTIFNMKKIIIKDNFSGSAPTPFVGRYNYPNINVGILSPQHLGEDNWVYDAPHHWSSKGYTIPSLVGLRSELVNSRFKANIRDVRGETNRYLDMAKEVGMASKPVDMEIKLSDVPKFSTNYDSYLAPTGPKAVLEKASITSNPKIDRKVDKVFDDTDLKAADAVSYLSKHDFDENFLSRMLSVGTLGMKKDRKLVPTRWSITATDDMLGKELISKVKDFSHSDYLAYFGSHLGNYYLILFFPDVWSYELFEMYASGKINEWSKRNLHYATDYEGYAGRKDYAHETAGGYYTPRLAVLEKLFSMKRQASVLVLRFITDEYTTPLGVWVTREAARNTMKMRPIEFGSKELMVTYAQNLAMKKFGIDISGLLSKSVLLNMIKTQTKLTGF